MHFWLKFTSFLSDEVGQLTLRPSLPYLVSGPVLTLEGLQVESGYDLQTDKIDRWHGVNRIETNINRHRSKLLHLISIKYKEKRQCRTKKGNIEMNECKQISLLKFGLIISNKLNIWYVVMNKLISLYYSSMWKLTWINFDLVIYSLKEWLTLSHETS